MKGTTCFVALITVLATVSLSTANTTTWTGGASDDWADAANWTGGVPDAETGAVFVQENAENLDITWSNAGNPVPVHSMVFNADLPGGGISLAGDTSARDIDLSNAGILVEAGSGPVMITPRETDEGNFTGRLRFPTSGTSYIINNSDSTLTIQGRLDRITSGDPRIYFNGSGDILFTGPATQWNSAAGRVRLEEDMTGRVIMDTGTVIQVQRFTEVFGGTLVLDGIVQARSNTYFNVRHSGLLTGNGIIGVQSTGGAGLDLMSSGGIRGGGTVNPGRPGEVGTLSFVNHDLRFNDATLRLDIANPNSHDKLLFYRHDPDDEVTVVPSLALQTFETGVTLDLNFLNDPVPGQYVILDGYQEITGEFVGWEDGIERILPGYEATPMRLNYHGSETILTVVPEPSTLLLLGLGSLVVMMRRKQ